MASKKFNYKSLARGLISIALFIVLWEIGSRSKQWLGADICSPLRGVLAALGFKTAYLPWVGAVPVQFIQALPYILTVVLLAGFIGKSVAPAALGRPYVKER